MMERVEQYAVVRNLHISRDDTLLIPYANGSITRVRRATNDYTGNLKNRATRDGTRKTIRGST